MLTELTNTSLWLIIALAAIIPVTIVLGFQLTSTKKQLKIVMNLVMETKNNCDRSIKRSFDSQTEITEIINELSEQVNSLSSSNKLVVKELLDKKQEKYWPTPDVVDQIRKSIEDLISIEMMLSSELSAPKAGYLYRITERVTKIYPNIDPEYICNKCTAIVNAFNRGQQQQSSE